MSSVRSCASTTSSSSSAPSSPTDSQGSSTIITTSAPVYALGRQSTGSSSISSVHKVASTTTSSSGRIFLSAAKPASSSSPPASIRYRASISGAGMSSSYASTSSGGGAIGGGLHSASGSANWPNSRAGRASLAGGTAVRPSSELLGVNLAAHQFASPETEAIDRWFEDLQHYEATLEEMAAASLDPHFKEELSAIEEWFRVLSEAERTAALYSLLQSSTQVQTRFFVTVLQQMARADPMSALLSPAKPGQASMEAQMEAKLTSLGLKSPSGMSMASPVMRQFARQSLSGSESYLSPSSASHSLSSSMSSNMSGTSSATSNATINAEEAAARLRSMKSSSRISAPANILLGANNSIDTGLKSPLWIEDRERAAKSAGSSNLGGSGIGRPKSTGSSASSTDIITNSVLSQSNGPSASYLRSSISGNTPTSASAMFDSQLSPIVAGGSWASMTSTPLVPMFTRKDGLEGMVPGDYGSPALDQSIGASGGSSQGIVLDDVRKFRRSMRMSGSGLNGGALGGMYEEQEQQQQNQQQQQQQQARQLQQQLSSHQQQLQQQQQQSQQQTQHHSQRRPSPLNANSMQQSAINLGFSGLTQPSPSIAAANILRHGSPGHSSSPSASQQTAVAAQTNWRNGLGSPTTLLASPQQFAQQQAQADLVTQQLAAYGIGNNVISPNNPLSANAQLANLFALQQQMIQQQQLQSMNLNLAAAAAGLTPQQMMGFQQQQQQQAMLSPRMAMNMMGMSNNLGMAGQSRRSPRPQELRSPNPRSPHPLSPSSNSAANVVTGSGTNPLEPLDMSLLADVSNWLRSLRLHKYTPQFEGSTWRQMVMMDEAALEIKGVSAVGARRKLLKVFETVRSKTGMALPGDGVSGASGADGATTNVSPSLSATEDA